MLGGVRTSALGELRQVGEGEHVLQRGIASRTDSTFARWSSSSHRIPTDSEWSRMYPASFGELFA